MNFPLKRFTTIKNTYRENIVLAKKIAYNKYIFELDNISKSTWKLINFETNRKRSYPTMNTMNYLAIALVIIHSS